MSDRALAGPAREAEDDGPFDAEDVGASGSVSGIESTSTTAPRTVELKRAINALDPQTQKYLHIDHYGNPLPEWMKWEKRPANNKWNHAMYVLYEFMTDPYSSTGALVVSYFLQATILISVISFCLETIPAFQSDRSPTAAQVFTLIETVTIQIFAADYLLRLLSCPDKLKFVVEPFNVIDLISIVPWYILIATSSTFSGTAVFRVVRLFRMFRVFKLGGHYTKLLVVLGSLRKSVDMLGLMIFLVSLGIVLFATLEFYAERGDWNAELGYYVRPNEPGTTADGEPKPSPFASIPLGFWWGIVTLMTVGYGDVFPITAAGKFIACTAIVCGVLALALPISVIGTTFINDWTAHVEEEEEVKAKEKELKAKGAPRETRLVVTSPALTSVQELLGHHLANVEKLVGLHVESEKAFDEQTSLLHDKLADVQRKLQDKDRAARRMRTAPSNLPDARTRSGRQLLRTASSADGRAGPAGGGSGAPEAERTSAPARTSPAAERALSGERTTAGRLAGARAASRYGSLSYQQVKDHLTALLETLHTSSEALAKRAAHVRNMGTVDAGLLDSELTRLVCVLAQRHRDLHLLLDKQEERAKHMQEARDGLKDKRAELQELQACSARHEAYAFAVETDAVLGGGFSGQLPGAGASAVSVPEGAHEGSDEGPPDGGR